jgi:hypothetical protein
VEKTSVKLVEGTIKQLVVEEQMNLGLWANILRTKCSFQRGIMLPIFSNMWLNKL